MASRSRSGSGDSFIHGHSHGPRSQNSGITRIHLDDGHISAWEDGIEAFEELFDVFCRGAIEHGDCLDFGEVFDERGQTFDGFGAGASTFVEDDLAIVEEEQRFDALERADSAVCVFEAAGLLEGIDGVDKEHEVCLTDGVCNEAFDFARGRSVLDCPGGAGDDSTEACREGFAVDDTDFGCGSGNAPGQLLHGTVYRRELGRHVNRKDEVVLDGQFAKNVINIRCAGWQEAWSQATVRNELVILFVTEFGAHTERLIAELYLSGDDTDVELVCELSGDVGRTVCDDFDTGHGVLPHG